MSDLADLIETVDGALETADASRHGRMLMRVTDLLADSAHVLSDAQIGAFDAVISRLVVGAQLDAREQVAKQVSALPQPPSLTVRRLASDPAGSVAAPVLSSRIAIPEEALVNLARVRGQEHLAAIAIRETLSARVSEAVAEKGDEHVLLTLLGNTGARLSERTLNLFAERIKDEGALAAGLAERGELASSQREAILRDRRTRKLVSPRSNDASRQELSRTLARAQASVALRIQIGLDEDDILHWLTNRRLTEALLGLAHLAGVQPELAMEAHCLPDAHATLLLVRCANVGAATFASYLRARSPACRGTELREALTTFNSLTHNQAHSQFKELFATKKVS